MPGFPTRSSGRLPKGDGIGRGRVRRTAPLAALSARTAGEAVVVGLRSKLTGADSAEFHVRTAERYAELLGRSKGALMKAGQMLSFVSVSPAVPAEFQSIYQAALTRLRDGRTADGARARARDARARAWHARTESAFAEFDWEPLAAASIGQVHAARLHDGRAVAVKIQYPGVADAICADLKNTELLATFLSLIVGGLSPRKLSLDLRGAAREIGARITEELDYRLEAANQAEFAEHYRGHPFIHVPRGGRRAVHRSRADPGARAGPVLERCAQRDAGAARPVGGGDPPLRLGLLQAPATCSTPTRIPATTSLHEDGSVSFLDFGCVKRLRRDQVEMIDAIFRECRRNDVLGTWRASVEAGVLAILGPRHARGSVRLLARRRTR